MTKNISVAYLQSKPQWLKIVGSLLVLAVPFLLFLFNAEFPMEAPVAPKRRQLSENSRNDLYTGLQQQQHRRSLEDSFKFEDTADVSDVPPNNQATTDIFDLTSDDTENTKTPLDNPRPTPQLALITEAPAPVPTKTPVPMSPTTVAPFSNAPVSMTPTTVTPSSSAPISASPTTAAPFSNVPVSIAPTSAAPIPDHSSAPVQVTNPPIPAPANSPAPVPATTTATDAFGNYQNVTYRPGVINTIENGLLLSDGLTSKIIALSGSKVAYHNGDQSDAKFHEWPDGGDIFVDTRPENPGGYILVSNSENDKKNAGGVGALTFDAGKFLKEMKRSDGKESLLT